MTDIQIVKEMFSVAFLMIWTIVLKMQLIGIVIWFFSKEKIFLWVGLIMAVILLIQPVTILLDLITKS